MDDPQEPKGSYYHTTWRTYASVSLNGDDLDPAEVTSFFEIQPSESFRAGDLRKNGRTWNHGHWALESQEHVKSKELADHIEWLLDQLGHTQPQEQAHSYIAKLQANNTITRIFCYWELRSGSGGPSFSPDLLRRIADFGLDLDIDFYCDCD
jgi:hypothetical protein